VHEGYKSVGVVVFSSSRRAREAARRVDAGGGRAKAKRVRDASLKRTETERRGRRGREGSSVDEKRTAESDAAR